MKTDVGGVRWNGDLHASVILNHLCSSCPAAPATFAACLSLAVASFSKCLCILICDPKKWFPLIAMHIFGMSHQDTVPFGLGMGWGQASFQAVFQIPFNIYVH